MNDFSSIGSCLYSATNFHEDFICVCMIDLQCKNSYRIANQILLFAVPLTLVYIIAV